MSASSSESIQDPAASVVGDASTIVGEGGHALEVSVFRGRNLAAKDSNGFSDPYLRVGLTDAKGKFLRKTTRKTAVHKKTLDPVFAASTWKWYAEDLAGAKAVKIEVWDHDVLTRDDRMGELVFELKKAEPFTVDSEWRAVQSRPGKSDRVQGDLLVTARYNVQGLSAQLNQPTVPIGDIRSQLEIEVAAAREAGNQEAVEQFETALAQIEEAERQHAESGASEPLRVALQNDPNVDPFEDMTDEASDDDDNDLDDDVPDSEKIECQVCWDSFAPAKMRTVGCGEHKYCKGCLRDHISAHVNRGEVMDGELTCPDPECKHAPDNATVRLLCGREVYVKFQEFQALRGLRDNPNARWCPRKECSCPVIVDPDTLPANFKVKCPACKEFFCFNCRRGFHEGTVCDDVKEEDEADASFRQYLENQGSATKACPRCHVAVSKNNGCNHIECAGCQANWCWLCLADLPAGQDQRGHFVNPSSTCNGHWFTNANSLEEANAVQNARREWRRKHPVLYGFQRVGRGVAVGGLVIVGVTGLVIVGVVVLAIAIPLGVISSVLSIGR